MRKLQKFGGAALLFIAGAFAATAVGAAENTWPSTKANAASPKVKGMPAVLQKNLATFDDLDFRVYSDEKWEDLHKSHSKDIVVHWPDGHTTKGIEKHIEDLKVMFSFAPDNRIVEHPVRFGTADGEWTGVSGWLEGTFTKPMALPDGTSIPPTGKSYRIPMATLGHWNKDGVMYEEHLFWDNGEFMKQIGLAK
jgi:hypothetical protein